MLTEREVCDRCNLRVQGLNQCPDVPIATGCSGLNSLFVGSNVADTGHVPASLGDVEV